MATESPSLTELAEAKIANFKVRFATDAAAADLTSELEALNVETVLGYMLLAKPYWKLIDEEDWDSLDLLIEAASEEKAQVYFSLSEEAKVLLRRYVRFFLKWAREVTKDGGAP